ncbi:hypothetical protein [uncultured Brachyspira sp.]|uniref:hypothetical protein n=1 Tax=uncultured Brachyspira sp. TaxID=221953 RepID=UPI0026283E37|nr:hypothetical protein [uncultured Brachyspira sp.]
MRFVKFVVLICFIIFGIMILNIIHKNKTVYDKKNMVRPFSYSDILYCVNGEIKSLASLSFTTSLDDLSNLFDIDKNMINNNILNKNINIYENNAQINVFISQKKIEQITLNITNNIDVSLSSIFKNLDNCNIALETERIEDSNGENLAEIYTHNGDRYKLVITKTQNDLSVDYVNLKIN